MRCKDCKTRYRSRNPPTGEYLAMKATGICRSCRVKDGLQKEPRSRNEKRKHKRPNN